MSARMDGVDAELARLLDVQPSADFSARVRQRVQSDPPHVAWGLVWRVAAVAALIVVAITLSFVARTPTPEPVSTAARLKPVPIPAPPAAQPQASTVREAVRVDAAPAPVLRRPAVNVPPRGSAPRAEAIVIVDEGQRAALEVMMRLVQEGRLDSSMLETPPSSALPLEANVEVAPLTVRALEILPIPGARTDHR